MFLFREPPAFFSKIRVVVVAENLQISNKEKRENKRGRGPAGLRNMFRHQEGWGRKKMQAW